MLAEKHLDDLLPILQETFTANCVGVDVIRAKALHAKVIDEPVLLHHFDILCNDFVRDISGDESECYGETVPLK